MPVMKTNSFFFFFFYQVGVLACLAAKGVILYCRPTVWIGTGVDGSPNIIEHFKKAYPHIESRVVDCRLLDQKPGGLLVNESGALGNVAEVHSAIISGLVTQGIPVEQAREASPWWFPSQQAMKDLVEGAGFNWAKSNSDRQR